MWNIAIFASTTTDTSSLIIRVTIATFVVALTMLRAHNFQTCSAQSRREVGTKKKADAALSLIKHTKNETILSLEQKSQFPLDNPKCEREYDHKMTLRD